MPRRTPRWSAGWVRLGEVTLGAQRHAATYPALPEFGIRMYNATEPVVEPPGSHRPFLGKVNK
jgi:hypothetical protein